MADTSVGRAISRSVSVARIAGNDRPDTDAEEAYAVCGGPVKGGAVPPGGASTGGGAEPSELLLKHLLQLQPSEVLYAAAAAAAAREGAQAGFQIAVSEAVEQRQGRQEDVNYRGGGGGAGSSGADGEGLGILPPILLPSGAPLRLPPKW